MSTSSTLRARPGAYDDEPWANRIDDLVGPRSEQEMRRFESYCRWSLHAFIGAGLVILAAHAIAWGSRVSTAPAPTPAPTAVMGVLLAAAAVVWMSAIGVIVDRSLRERPLPRGSVPALVATGSLLTLAFASLPSMDRIREVGAGGMIACGPVPLAALGSLLVVVWPTRRVVAVLLLGMACLAMVYAVGPPRLPGSGVMAMLTMGTLWCALIVPTSALTKWMIDVVHRLWRSREAAADLAVAQERLRFSRDLHDVFGRTLSTVAVKSELAAEFARRGDSRAVDEMLSVRDLAQTSLSDVRGVVRGYRRIDLVDEVVGAQALLRTAGIPVTTSGLEDVSGVATSLPDRSVDALAWSVREAVTNVLRHGGATTAHLALEDGDRTLRLLVENDAPRRPGDGTVDGSGLLGLRERLTAAGGSLETRHADRSFRLVATVPR